MCSYKTYLVSVVLVAASLAEETQWSPYNMNLQQYNFQQEQQAAEALQDQQWQASDLSGGSHGSSGGFESLQGGHDFGGSQGGHDFGGSQSFSGGHDFGGQDFKSHAYPVHQHIEEENPEPIKHYKEVIVPQPKNVEFKVHHPIIIPVPHPVPIHVPVPKAVVIPIIKEVSIPVEKSVPYPVEKTVHVPKFKDVPFQVIKHIIVPVEKPVPFKVPVYETVIHTKKGSHKI